MARDLTLEPHGFREAVGVAVATVTSAIIARD